MELFSHKETLLQFNTNNGLLRFLFEQAPQVVVVEDLIDSHRTLDGRIRTTCEKFITQTHKVIARPLVELHAHLIAVGRISRSSPSTSGQHNSNPSTHNGTSVPSITQTYDLFRVHQLLKEQKSILINNLPLLQRKMSLYLANRDTELILFRPVADKMVRAYAEIHRGLGGSLPPLPNANHEEAKLPTEQTSNLENGLTSPSEPGGDSHQTTAPTVVANDKQSNNTGTSSSTASPSDQDKNLDHLLTLDEFVSMLKWPETWPADIDK